MRRAGRPCRIRRATRTRRIDRFGSAHTIGFHASFCDGTVRMLKYDIDLAVFSYLGNRKDGEVFDDF